MGYAEALAAILLGCGVALGLSFGAHRWVRLETRLDHHEVGSAVFLQLGVLFAVLLAFVFSEVYAEYNAAQRAVDLECGALHATAILASALPAPEMRDLLRLEADYAREVIGVEWPALRRSRQRDEAAAAVLTTLMRHVALLPAADPSVGPVKSQLLASLAEAHAERETRLFEATNGLPAVVWIVLIGFSLVLMAFVAFSGLRDVRSMAMFSVLFGACVGATLVLVQLLDYPFEGAIALSPRDFAATLDKILALLRAA